MIRRIALATLTMLAAGPALADITIVVSNNSSASVQFYWSGDAGWKTIPAGGSTNLQAAGSGGQDVIISAGGGKTCTMFVAPVIVDQATRALRCDPQTEVGGSGVQCSAGASQNNVPNCVVMVTFNMRITE